MKESKIRCLKVLFCVDLSFSLCVNVRACMPAVSESVSVAPSLPLSLSLLLSIISST